MKNRLLKPLILLVLALLPASAPAHAQTAWAEFDPFTGNNVTQVVTGTLNGVRFTMTFNDGGSLQWGARGSFSKFNNTSSAFNFGFFTPATNRLDALSLVKFGSAGNATLTITFAAPVTNPTFHFFQLDRASYDFSATPGLPPVTVLSASSQLVQPLAGGTLVRDNNGSPYPAAGGHPRPGTSGSFQLTGTFSTVTVNLVQAFGAPDGHDFQMSVNASPPSPCGAGARCVFVTQNTWDGNLGGLAGADQKCQAAANAAGLPGTYKAWLSSDSASAASRLAHSPGPYNLMNGTTIANNWTDLTDGTLAAPINLSENGVPPTTTGQPLAWTNTRPDGTIFEINAPQVCNNWTTNAASDGLAGAHIDSGPPWTEASPEPCVEKYHLYCIQQ